MNTLGDVQSQGVILPTIQYSYLITGCITTWTSSSFGKRKSYVAQSKMPDEISGLADDSSKPQKPQKTPPNHQTVAKVILEH